MRLGHIEKIQVRQYADGRWGFDDYTRGSRHKIRRRTKHRAVSRAIEIEVFLQNGRKDLLGIDPFELAEFRRWKSAKNSSRTTSEIISEFLQLKRNKGSRTVRSLTGDLRLFESFVDGTTPIAAVTAPQIQRFIDSRGVGERRKFNLRAATVSLFRWARRMSYLDPDRATEADKVERIERRPGKANILTPEQMRILLDHVQDQFCHGLRPEHSPVFDRRKSLRITSRKNLRSIGLTSIGNIA